MAVKVKTPTPDERAAAIIAGEPLPPDNGKRKRKSRVDPNETKSQRFRRLADQRGFKAVAYMKLLVPLANRAQYEYGPEEIQGIISGLLEAVAKVKRAFEGQQEDTRTSFFH